MEIVEELYSNEIIYRNITSERSMECKKVVCIESIRFKEPEIHEPDCIIVFIREYEWTC